MKVKLCSFNGYKTYSSHGKHYASINGNKVSRDDPVKCVSAFLFNGNTQQITWTVLYRQKYEKGQSEEIQKKHSCCAVKFQALPGASLAEIVAKRSQRHEVRKAQREQACRAAKEAKQAKPAAEKVSAAPAKASQNAAPKQTFAKPIKSQVPHAGGKCCITAPVK
ncbi:large ribosomal subunit protein eL24-like [Stegostoma tigrinum]|uniref:large ribosomal subunit protein eL24-like n=1 Tax=Stegostoma tigrinum TaxID=3053191 RepID=UPI0028709D57|nr:large ribosomal subunit protein eL24-like [Stegostoma tigrinum]